MSAASTPTPYPKSFESRSASKYTAFWPLLVFFFGIGALSGYQVNAMQDRLDELGQTIQKMDVNVKKAQYVKAKFFSIAKDLLALAPQNTSANEIVTRFKLREMQAAQPALFSQDYAAQIASAEKAFAAQAPAAVPSSSTNSSLLPSAPAPDAAAGVAPATSAPASEATPAPDAAK
jgi:hypothetical protein